MAGKLFVTCAVTGSSPIPSHPNFPFRPDHVAAEALAAAEAGASIIHVHVRDRETGDPSQALEDYREVVGLIRAKNNEVILNVTTGPGCTWMQGDEDPAVCGPGTLMFTAERRLEHILDLKPDMCTLDICTMQLWGGVAINLDPMITKMGHMIQDAGVLPEIECFEAGDFVFADDLMAKGAIPKNVPFTFVLGTKYGLPATTEAMLYAKNQIPRGRISPASASADTACRWRRSPLCWVGISASGLKTPSICGAAGWQRTMRNWYNGPWRWSIAWAVTLPAPEKRGPCWA